MGQQREHSAGQGQKQGGKPQAALGQSGQRLTQALAVNEPARQGQAKAGEQTAGQGQQPAP